LACDALPNTAHLRAAVPRLKYLRMHRSRYVTAGHTQPSYGQLECSGATQETTLVAIVLAIHWSRRVVRSCALVERSILLRRLRVQSLVRVIRKSSLTSS